MPDARPARLAAQVKVRARSLGFQPVRITTAEPFSKAEAVILDRMKQGLMDGLPWFHEARVRRGCNPEAVLTGARSLIALGLPYYSSVPQIPASDHSPRGRVSRYAWGTDYHRTTERRAKQLILYLKEMGGASRFYVDYGALPDRAVAVRAGVGWFGKNTNILTSASGSWVFLAEIVTDLELAPDVPVKKSCGRCTVCIPACPTGAIVAPYTIDNKRCISYQTIENRGPIPRHLRSLMGDWVFGCDICQDVCPVNHHSQTAGDASFAAASLDAARPDLIALLHMTESEFATRYRGSAIRRATWPGLMRNVCVALGNSGSAAAVPPLAEALKHPATLVRGHAAWALGRLGGQKARAALAIALKDEIDPEAMEEMRAALAELVDRLAVSA